MTWPEVGGSAVLAVPVGSLEQHGPHLPLDTDTRIATALAGRLAASRPGVVVGPPLAYGASGEHDGFAGTVSIGCAAVAGVLVELVRSARASFAGVVLVSAHGGNAAAVGRARARCRAEGDRVLAWQAAVEGGDAHAGRTETSLLLAIEPDVVRRSRAEAGNTEPLDRLLPALRRGGVRAASPNGVLGDPAGAGAEEGRRVLGQLASDLASAYDRWRGAW